MYAHMTKIPNLLRYRGTAGLQSRLKSVARQPAYSDDVEQCLGPRRRSNATFNGTYGPSGISRAFPDLSTWRQPFPSPANDLAPLAYTLMIDTFSAVYPRSYAAQKLLPVFLWEGCSAKQVVSWCTAGSTLKTCSWEPRIDSEQARPRDILHSKPPIPVRMTLIDARKLL